MGNQFSPKSKHVIRYAGRYVVLLVNGVIAPINTQQAQFIRAVKGEEKVTRDLERDMIRFISEHPDLVENTLNQARSNSSEPTMK